MTQKPMPKKTYHYVLMTADFINSPHMVRLSRINPDYFRIYNLILISAAKEDGYLNYYGLEDTVAGEVAGAIKESEEDVQEILSFLTKFGKMFQISDSQFFLPDSMDLTNRENGYNLTAIRKQADAYRKSKENKEEIKTESNENADENKDEVKTDSKDSTDEYKDESLYTSHIEKIRVREELDIDKRKEKEKKKTDEAELLSFSQSVIDYLNQKTGKSFQSGRKDTLKFIRARRNEGYILQDFFTVIDIKTREWGSDPKWQKYLRPETLFGNKFESYLQSGTNSSNPSSDLETWHPEWMDAPIPEDLEF